MLFDLRGRGRRRTVRVIYLGMAVLMGVGLIGFGIGGGFGSSGIFNAASNNNGSGSASYGDQVKQDVKQTQRQPSNAAAWAKLARDSFLLAGTGGNYDNSTANGSFTAQAQPVLAQVKNAWNHYLALNPNPSPDLATEMVQVFEGPGGLNDPASAVAALQIVIAANPASASNYERLAVYAYQAGNARQGDLAAAKAVSLTPVAQRATTKAELAALKKNPNALNSTSAASTSAASTGASTVVTVPTKSGTTH
jgi:hypothetical protein